MTVFSAAVMGLLGFGPEFGLTIQNLTESIGLIFLMGLPFAVLFSLGAYLFMRKGQSGNLPMTSAEWLKSPYDRAGHVVYCFTLNGLGEEMFYRGLIQGFLSVNMAGFIFLGSFSLMYSTLFASILFVLIHLENVLNKDETLAEYFFMLPYRTIIAFILGITFQLTGSLLAPIIIHNVSNGFLSIAAIQAMKNSAHKAKN